MSRIIQLNSENFDDFVLNGKKPSVVDFSADWCGPCKRLYPVIEEVASEYSDQVFVCQLDIDDVQDVASRYRISSIPCILFYKNGEVIDRITGLTSKEKITEKIRSSLL